MSLANLLDIQQAPDLLRGLLNTLAEYETEDGDKSKMVCFLCFFPYSPLSTCFITAIIQVQTQTTNWWWVH